MSNDVFKVLGAAALAASAFNCVGDRSGSSRFSLTGAIFTSLADGSSVNQNLYDAKEDVHLDGGPGLSAPPGAAALPEGDYYFQVTDPSGGTLLSTDAIECRSFHVSADGVTTSVNPGPAGCEHATGTDGDHSALGAVTVQLMPYDDTPNNGGEYKVWVTAVDDYAPGEGKHGFVAKDSKTDNFKVKVAPACGDGQVDDGEECDDGNTDDEDGCASDCTAEDEPACGDGVLHAGEECDDGNLSDLDGCSSTCTTDPACGDGTLDDGEECDDGDTDDGDGCSANCTVEDEPACGDGVLNGGEECDDGNSDDGDGCSSTCDLESEPACGDGVTDQTEDCDDGNLDDGDGCSSRCTLEHTT